MQISKRKIRRHCSHHVSRSLLLGRAAEAKPQAAAAISLAQFPPPNPSSATSPATISISPTTTNRAIISTNSPQSSNRIKLINVGKTTRGLDWEIAIISSPENLAAARQIQGHLAPAGARPRPRRRRGQTLAHEGKAIVHIDGGLHATEVAGAQHSILLAYKLVTAQGDPEVDAILDNVILMLWPTLNPDGQNEVVAWYRKNVGTPYEVSPLPDLYQEYVGHDNNRDGYMNNMVESQDVTRSRARMGSR